MQLINFIRKKVFTVYSRLLFNTIMGILKAYLQYKFTAQGERTGVSFFEVSTSSSALSSMGFTWVVSQFPARCFGKLPGSTPQ